MKCAGSFGFLRFFFVLPESSITAINKFLASEITKDLLDSVKKTDMCEITQLLEKMNLYIIFIQEWLIPALRKSAYNRQKETQ